MFDSEPKGGTATETSNPLAEGSIADVFDSEVSFDSKATAMSRQQQVTAESLEAEDGLGGYTLPFPHTNHCHCPCPTPITAALRYISLPRPRHLQVTRKK